LLAVDVVDVCVFTNLAAGAGTGELDVFFAWGDLLEI